MHSLFAHLSAENLDSLIRISVFAVATLMTLGVILILAPRIRRRNLLMERIGRAVQVPVIGVDRTREGDRLGWMKSVGEVLAPKKASELSSIRAKLSYAGFRKQPAVGLFYGLKAVAAIGVGLLYILFELAFAMPLKSPLLMMIVVMVLGYFIPDIFLSRLVKRRQLAIFRTLPDAMDLMIVCLESGLGTDATLKKVGEEIGEISPVLGQEFGTLSVELQTGAPRAQALQNLADRNGEAGLRNLARVMIQADRFGTSIAQSLRVHSESMTTKRIQMVEELAGKATVKLVFPLVLCILPALWIVLVGPALIRLFAALKGAAH